jgi:hypothetical protein
MLLRVLRQGGGAEGDERAGKEDKPGEGGDFQFFVQHFQATSQGNRWKCMRGEQETRQPLIGCAGTGRRIRIHYSREAGVLER